MAVVAGAFDEKVRAGDVRFVYRVRLHGASGFADRSNLYVRYCVDLHPAWRPAGDSALAGRTQQSVGRQGLHHFDHRFEIDATRACNDLDELEVPWPVLLVEVCQVDWWRRERAVAYGFVDLPSTAGPARDLTIHTWKPQTDETTWAGNATRLRQHFLHLAPRLEDLTYAAIPDAATQVLARYPFASEPQGVVVASVAALKQTDVGQSFRLEDLVYGDGGRAAATASGAAVDDVVDACRRARRRLRDARQALLD